jgi:hypothetical protein
MKMMQAINIQHFFLIVMLVCIFVIVVPIVKLLRRTGHHPLWSLFVIFPALNVIAFWIFAFKPWPTDKPSDNK